MSIHSNVHSLYKPFYYLIAIEGCVLFSVCLFFWHNQLCLTNLCVNVYETNWDEAITTTKTMKKHPYREKYWNTHALKEKSIFGKSRNIYMSLTYDTTSYFNQVNCLFLCVMFCMDWEKWTIKIKKTRKTYNNFHKNIFQSFFNWKEKEKLPIDWQFVLRFSSKARSVDLTFFYLFSFFFFSLFFFFSHSKTFFHKRNKNWSLTSDHFRILRKFHFYLFIYYFISVFGNLFFFFLFFYGFIKRHEKFIPNA